ncbi:hypothetical protein HDU96_003138, partial [Phlyctochytrium bullatum]
GASVVAACEEAEIPFTGAALQFFEVTTSKTELKQRLLVNNVETSTFIKVEKGREREAVEKASKEVKFPIIVKPDVSYASLSITDKSVVENADDCIAQIELVQRAAPQAGVFLERFFGGREFTVVVAGEGQNVRVFPAAERVFSPDLARKQRILAFDRYWDGYTLTGGTGAAKPLYHYALAQEDWQSTLQDLALRAYRACSGNGYGRVDIRTESMDKCDAYVLEVNANCGLSFGAGSSSLGEVLALSGVLPEDFLAFLLNHARSRAKGDSSRDSAVSLARALVNEYQ